MNGWMDPRAQFTSDKTLDRWESQLESVFAGYPVDDEDVRPGRYPMEHFPLGYPTFSRHDCRTANGPAIAPDTRRLKDLFPLLLFGLQGRVGVDVYNRHGGRCSTAERPPGSAGGQAGSDRGRLWLWVFAQSTDQNPAIRGAKDARRGRI